MTMFALTRPCVNCPFRVGIGSTFQLQPERLEEIRTGTAFQCHKTVDYTDDGPGQPGDRPAQCAGLMTVLHRINQPNQMMQVASRLGYLDLDALDPQGEAYQTWDAVKAAHIEGQEP